MLVFIYGEDTYSVKAKSREIAASFVEAEKSDLNLIKLDGSKLTLDTFLSAAFTPSFFGEKKLVLIQNFLLENENKDLKKAIAVKLDNIPDFVKLVFAEEGMPDQRESIFKKLLAKAEVSNFKQMDELKLRQWITAKAKDAQSNISNPALSKLSLYVGGDLWRLENEIGKLSSYAVASGKNEISDTDVEILVEPNNNLKIFDLTDALANKDAKKAVKVFYAFVNAGEDIFKIFNLIIYQLRNMIIISDLARTMAKQEIAKTAGLHPFVVQKIEYSLKKFKEGELEKLYEQVGEIDWKIKNGDIDAELAINMLLVDFTRSGKIS